MTAIETTKRISFSRLSELVRVKIEVSSPWRVMAIHIAMYNAAQKRGRGR